MHYKYVVLSLLLICSFSNAEVYTWINKDGGREYGDEPPADAQKADLPTLHTISNKKEPEVKSDLKAVKLSPKSETSEFLGYELLTILYPKEDDTIVASKAGTASVQIHI